MPDERGQDPGPIFPERREERPPAARALLLVARTGQMMLEAGAEVSRVEETMERMMAALGYPGCQSFVTPTGLFLSAGAAAGAETILRRVRRRDVNLARIGALNALARELEARPGAAGLEVLEQKIESLRAQASVSLPLAVLAGAVAAAAATVLVGGTTLDLIPAFLANVVVQLLLRLIGRTVFPEFFHYFAAGTTSVIMAQLLRVWWPELHSGLVVAGGIMTLVPGVAFTASIQDAMYGELVSATARGLEAVMKAAGLALGATAGLFLARGFVPIQVSTVGWVPLVTSAGFAVILSLGSAVGFQVDARAWLPAAMAGGVTWWSYVFILERSERFGLAVFSSAAVLGLVAYLFARAFRLPTTSFVVPGFIPLVPGVTVYRAILGVVQGDTVGSFRLFYDALLAAGAIAAGIALSTAIVRSFRRPLA
ncbi:threonine/serine exporter family protein [Limnochorda pilosa]|uniref:Threonine/serine exporter-like N-terminal domain-containing protein n=1 Tax=Limnochorda pilosa TaxID=1555112 RepID=A0A0K2SII2_LIMPI|nr:threonine/serine exporter family protein [Limnochorda pilosa]BAS26936.1 hypothetical protein LIP_1079 [Limnochorda pilosa]